MQIVKGGYNFVEFDSDPNFSNPIRIDKLLKAGTGFTPSTPTEEGADNLPMSAGKTCTINIRSANVDDAVGSPYALLKAAEEARTPLHFRFVKLLGDDLAIENGDDAWNESVHANVTASIDASDKKQGGASAKFACNGVVNAGEILATEVINANLSTYKTVSFWIKADFVERLQLLLDDHANCISPLATLSVPVLETGVWTRCIIVLPNPSALTSLISIGIKAVDQLGASDNVWIDDVRGMKGHVTVVKSGVIHIQFEDNEAGKHNAIRITGGAFADSEANLLTTNF